MLVRILYAVVLVLVLAIGWRLWGIHQAYSYLERDVQAQSYGADPADAKVTIIAVVDYSSASSRDINAALMQAVASVPDARVIFTPLPQPRPLPMKVARLALAAEKQGKFMALHEEFMRNDRPFTDPVMREIAERTGVDFDRLQNDAATKETAMMLYKAAEAAGKLGITHTPTLILNRKNFFVPKKTLTDVPEFLQLIKDARS
jgi:predicted DsbA family dithiol-disulfide isomerase